MYLNLNFKSRNNFPSFSIVLLLFLSKILYLIYSKTSLFPYFYWKLSSMSNCSSLKLIYIFSCCFIFSFFLSHIIMSMSLSSFSPTIYQRSYHDMSSRIFFVFVLLRFAEILESTVDIFQQFVIISSMYYKNHFRYWTFNFLITIFISCIIIFGEIISIFIHSFLHFIYCILFIVNFSVWITFNSISIAIFNLH